MSASTSLAAAAPAQPEPSSNTRKPPVVLPGTGNNIIINPCQRGNPILECVRNVGKEFGDIVADYQVGRTTGVLFLSLRYHRLHPEYIHQRIERLGRSYSLRILLLMCDVSEHQEPLRELTKICLINNVTIMVAWNAEEAGFYLSTYKQFEHKPPDMIKERVDKDYHSVLRTALTTISKVNKTDVETLRTSLGSFADIARASADQLQNLPGFGQVKAKRIVDAFEKPFRNNSTSKLSSQSRLELTQAIPADKGKEKEHEQDSTPGELSTVNPANQRRPREPSPPWDIELGLNASPPSSREREVAPTVLVSQPPDPAVSAIESQTDAFQQRKRPPSPAWDIELDLNDSDLEQEETAPSKRRRTEDGFGEPLFLSQS